MLGTDWLRRRRWIFVAKHHRFLTTLSTANCATDPTSVIRQKISTSASGSGPVTTVSNLSPGTFVSCPIGIQHVQTMMADGASAATGARSSDDSIAALLHLFQNCPQDVLYSVMRSM
jgi:hypothetical protein